MGSGWGFALSHWNGKALYEVTLQWATVGSVIPLQQLQSLEGGLGIKRRLFI